MIETLAKATMGLYAFWNHSDEQTRWFVIWLVAAGLVVLAVGSLIEHLTKGKSGSGEHKEKVEQ